MLDIESFRDYCLKKPGVTNDFPFDETTLVFRVMNKIFAITNVESFEFINLKCDPERAIELREQYPAIQPGYHMNKKLWNSVYIDGTLGDQFIFELVDDSYDLIVESLPKKLKQELSELSNLG